MSNYHGTTEKLFTAEMEACNCQKEKVVKPSNVFGRLTYEENNQPQIEDLKSLANKMKEASENDENVLDMPIGMVFLGQFIDHDLTLDTTTELGHRADVTSSIMNLRSPRLDLDSVYLSGPEASSYLYDSNGATLTLGTDCNSKDLQRNKNKRAIIGDPRNDENIFIAQLHSLFIQVHNKLIQAIGGDLPTHGHFDTARRVLRGVYQTIIIDEFLPMIIDKSVYQPLFDGAMQGALPGPINWSVAPDMPVEFSAAAYRFGHSQIKQNYKINNQVEGNLFEFGAFNVIPEICNMDYKLFFNIDGTSYQKARKIDTALAPALFNLPFVDPASLAERNLVRGQLTFNLPYGEDLADHWFPKNKIDAHPMLKEVGLEKSPLWFYVLVEAEQYNGKLGPVGGSIVGGTILNILLRDESSIINNKSITSLFKSYNITPSMKGMIEFL